MNEEKSLTVYSNRAELLPSAFDLKLIFQMEEDGKIDDLVKIFLSWPHAKRLYEILTQRIDEYEKIYSKIITEPNQDALNILVKEGKIKVVDKNDGR